MIIDDKITGARIKTALKSKKNIFWCIGICVLAFLLFYTLTNINTKTVTVWESGSLIDCYMTREAEKRADDFCAEQGLAFDLLIRSKDDRFYDAAFSTSGAYISDILLLSGEEMQRYQEDGIFSDLQNTALAFCGEDGFYCGDRLLGIRVAEDKYLALNVRSDIEQELLEEVVYRIFGKEPRK